MQAGACWKCASRIRPGRSRQGQNRNPGRLRSLIARFACRRSAWRGPCPGPCLSLPTLEVLAELCGQSLLARRFFVGFAHRLVRGDSLKILPDQHRFFALRQEMAYGINRQLFGADTSPPARCSSSVVEHSLGKGEVESSILSCSTISLAVDDAPGEWNPCKVRISTPHSPSMISTSALSATSAGRLSEQEMTDVVSLAVCRCMSKR